MKILYEALWTVGTIAVIWGMVELAARGMARNRIDALEEGLERERRRMYGEWPR